MTVLLLANQILMVMTDAVNGTRIRKNVCGTLTLLLLKTFLRHMYHLVLIGHTALLHIALLPIRCNSFEVEYMLTLKATDLQILYFVTFRLLPKFA